MEKCEKCGRIKDVECFLHDEWCSKCDGLDCKECEKERNEALNVLP